MRDEFGGLNQRQVEGLNFLLNSVEADPHITDVREVAYMLATMKHETAGTYLPIHEYGTRQYFITRYGGQTKIGKRLGNETAEDGATYAGRGDVQLTGKDNYEKAEAALRREYPELIARFEQRTGHEFDLTVGDQPGDSMDADNAQDPEVAYAIMSFGMRTGMFTGKKMSDYFTPALTDYVNARHIINGTDKAQAIATYAKTFERVLRAALLP